MLLRWKGWRYQGLSFWLYQDLLFSATSIRDSGWQSGRRGRVQGKDSFQGQPLSKKALDSQFPHIKTSMAREHGGSYRVDDTHSSHRPELGSVSWHQPGSSLQISRLQEVHPARVCLDHSCVAGKDSDPSLSDSRSCRTNCCGQGRAGIPRAGRLPNQVLCNL